MTKIEIEVWNVEEAKIAGAAIVGIQKLRDDQRKLETAVPHEWVLNNNEYAPPGDVVQGSGIIVEVPQGNAETAVPITDEDLNAKTRAYANDKGVPAVRAILNEYGVKRAPEIPQEKRAEYLARLV